MFNVYKYYNRWTTKVFSVLILLSVSMAMAEKVLKAEIHI